VEPPLQPESASQKAAKKQAARKIMRCIEVGA
jgi:hypothetical protein